MGKVNARALREYTITMCTMILEILIAATTSRDPFLVAINIHTQGVAEQEGLVATKVRTSYNINYAHHMQYYFSFNLIAGIILNFLILFVYNSKYF